MKHGFISVACGTPRLRLADCHYNAEQTFTLMRAADKAGVRVLVLPELGLTGYTCADLFRQDTLLNGAEEALSTVLEATRPLELVAAVGLPVRKDNRVYNCTAIIQRGNVLGVVPKRYPADDGVWNERRWFSDAAGADGAVTLCGQQVPFGALLFTCREMPELVLGFEVGSDAALPEAPAAELTAAGATVIGNPAAESELAGSGRNRRRMVAAQSARLLCGYIHTGCGEGESATDAVFGAHQLIAEMGEVLQESRFKAGFRSTEIDVQKIAAQRRRTRDRQGPALRRIAFSLSMRETVLTRYIAPTPFVPEEKALRDERCHEILLMASLGLKQRMEHVHAKTAVIGLSGGLDSTLALLIADLAMKMLDRAPADILAVTMPCFGTTSRTRHNAEILAERIGATLCTVDISDAVRGHFRDIGHSAEDYSVTYENAQARERTQVLMDMANDRNGLVVGTGDLSELALGWCTYNGDHMSMYDVNSSIPKTLMRHLVEYLADDYAADAALHGVLKDILATPISPELLPAVKGKASQDTEALVGPYELVDFFLYYVLRWGFSPQKIFRLAQYVWGEHYSREVLLARMKMFYSRFFASQFKRNCLPEGPGVGTVTLSPRGGWAMPGDANGSLWQAELDMLSV